MFLLDSYIKIFPVVLFRTCSDQNVLRLFEQIAFPCAWGNENPFASWNCHFCSYVKSIMNLQWSIKHIWDIKCLTYKV